MGNEILVGAGCFEEIGGRGEQVGGIVRHVRPPVPLRLGIEETCPVGKQAVHEDANGECGGHHANRFSEYGDRHLEVRAGCRQASILLQMEPRCAPSIARQARRRWNRMRTPVS